MKKTLEMTFVLDNGKTRTLSLSDPRDDLRKADVDEFTALAIAKKALVVNGALPISANDPIIRTVTEDLLE